MQVTQATKGSYTGGNTLVALGSNATSQHGTPRETVEKAVAALNAGPVHVVATSRFYLTPFIPVGQGADVVNAVALVETALPPEALLAHLHAVEARFDRERGTRWGDRTLDLDIVAMGDLVLPDAATVRRWMDLAPERQKREAPDRLILPHPRLQDRAFVLVPAADIAPDWAHPLTGQTIRNMRDALPGDEVAAVRVLEERP
ncbi:2-amino-4-hydroxy-6-hydroxymethyldihydropteridine diphosphokinase [Sinisalibacter aestuarii]|uniref:2-amino-4-hydroxy-6-hydroxymethyldihydropteridine pyrophosphokinase n=1 Tax=Sinisalibacter aestuarii TaxID=2949426 RepID=A0ABQ5LP67_9RHOB|nr:2-amino-4-hydroxy-6-hydroxymethyldihydropteridine diphosphokinase [Sinisalibacter aestuarii]GKY86200.1 2-amino-4-hydroxy-6-hydroxymethyldihydropteridine pyrophosphokinase [Sinisalibacter aestuarii]